MTPLLLLAEKVEGLSGPDREVDAEIAATLRVGTEHRWALNYPAWFAAMNGRVHLEKNGPSFASPAFTASLDAAMSLVPEGWQIDLGDWAIEGDDDVRAGICWTATMEPYNRGKGVHADAATPSLALCAAALRARAAMEAGDE